MIVEDYLVFIVKCVREGFGFLEEQNDLLMDRVIELLFDVLMLNNIIIGATTTLLN